MLRASVLLPLIVGPVGCGNDESDAPSLSPSEVEEAAEFRGYQVLWVGNEFDGRRAAFLDRSGNTAVVSYGDCGATDSGCTNPLEITTEPMEKVGPLSELKRFNGIPGIELPEEGANGFLLRLFARDLRVEIDAENKSQALLAVKALEALNDPSHGKPRLLP